jgi:hypothetical protein
VIDTHGLSDADGYNDNGGKCPCQLVAETCGHREKRRFVSKKRAKMCAKDFQAAKESATVRRYIGKGIGEFCAMKMCEANRRNPRRSRSFVEGVEGSSKRELRENVVNLQISLRRYENAKICAQGLCRLITKKNGHK